jgi:hypothetical protein
MEEGVMRERGQADTTILVLIIALVFVLLLFVLLLSMP